MKALLKQGTSVAVRTVPRPALQAADEVVLCVAVAGLCRTDLYVAEGRLPGPDPLILGHEFSGVVESCGPAVRGLSRGDRVAVMPIIWCGCCKSCACGQETTCLQPAMLGVHRDGAFAEFVALPSRCVYRIPDSLSFVAAAYAEPVAAALAVLNAGLQPEEKGLIYGQNRFSLLLRQILEAHGFRQVGLHDPERDPPLEANGYDFIVETFATRAALAEIIRAVRPYGKIVFKSRQPFPAAIDLPAAIAKELTFRAVNYGPFPKALALLAEGQIEINGLLGPVHPLEDFERIFADARRREAGKAFFSLPVTMCGIVSICSVDEPVEERTLRRGMAALRHRGPDGEGLWLSPDRRTGLGHTRLSIIDVATGGQPLLSEDGQIVLVVNGEFYGFEEIRRDLEQRGHHFRTRSDSEIALHLYEEHGIDCLPYLRGEFALILWDRRRRRLLAARDRFGIKPLCYAKRPDRLVLASEAKALFACGVEPAWDRESFFQASTMQYVLPDRTLFAGVRQLQPGHYLLATDGKVEIQRYWEMDFVPVAETLPEDRERCYAEELAMRLDEAVRLRLRADVPVCFHLSGGLDSSAVVGLAARRGAAPLDCFTVGFEEEGYNELELARHTARHVGATLHAVPVRQADLLEHLADAVYYSEGLAINGHLRAKFLLSRAIRRAGFKVVLSGEGADEILAGYPHLRRDLLLSEDQPDQDALVALLAGNTVMTGIQLAEGESLSLAAVQQTLGFVPSFLEAKGTLGRRLRDVLAQDFVAEFAERDCFRLFLDGIDVAGQLAGRHRVDQASFLWSKLALANYILRTLGDGTEMAHAVEGRLPFLDHHLFEFVRRLPMTLKIRGDVEKFLLREAVRPAITEAVYRRRKHPFTAPPLGHFASPELNGYLQDRVRSRAFANLPFFDREKVLRLLQKLPTLEWREHNATDPVLMMILSATAMQERFGL